MDDILSRLARLESDQSGLRRGLAVLDQEAVRSRRESTAAQDAELLARLSPGSLGAPVGARGARFDTLPALGAPLLQRLRDDAGLSAHAGGRTDPPGGYGNALADPTFDTLVEATIGTAYTAIGANWEAKYVLNSGTVATTRTLGPGAYRGDFGNNATSSATADLYLDFGVDASDMTVYLRPPTGVVPGGGSAAIPSWVAVAVRAAVYSLTNVTATAYMEIENGTGTVLASGDAEDLVNLLDLAEWTRLEAALADPTVAGTYRWRLRIDVTKTAGSVGAATLLLAEPLWSLSDDGSAPMFTPAVGGWFPGMPGYQLVDRVYVQNDIPASTTAYISVGDIAVPNTLPERWAGSVVGVSYRMDGALTAGTLAIKVHKNGTSVWTAFSLTSASAQEGYVKVAMGTYTFSAGDDIQVEIVTNGAFLPTTRDIVVEVSRLITYTGG